MIFVHQNDRIYPHKVLVPENGKNNLDVDLDNEGEPSDDFEYIPPQGALRPIMYTQTHLDALVRTLKMSQRDAEKLTADLKLHNVLAEGVKVTAYRHRQSNFLPHFTGNDTNDFVHCNNIDGLMPEMGIEYSAEQWRLFIDSSKSALKAVLLYFDNSKPPVPVAYATNLAETYDSMKLILDSVRYNDHQWRLCCDLKVVGLLRGLQSGWVSNPCFICLWDSRFKGNQYAKTDWEMREHSQIGLHNVVKEPLVPPDKIMLPPLHIKLGLMTSFTKAIRENGEAMEYLKSFFSDHISPAKVMAGK